MSPREVWGQNNSWNRGGPGLVEVAQGWCQVQGWSRAGGGGGPVAAKLTQARGMAKEATEKRRGHGVKRCVRRGLRHAGCGIPCKRARTAHEDRAGAHALAGVACPRHAQEASR